jgi:REP element-mobilizing transposase RayT
MHHQVLVHVVWTTRDREASLDCARAAYLWERLPIIARQERGRILELGVVTTHLHLLVRLHPTTQLPRMLQRMKGGTAYGINGGASTDPNRLRWAKGYSVISVSPRALLTVAAYVRDQHLHHPGQAIAGWNNPPVMPPTFEHRASTSL